MLIILSQTNDPYQNIATEEFLLKNFTDDIFFLYINSKSIIVGKHQNALSEINYNFVVENDIPVIRRLSGGGTVFHDPGNINFCFITSGAKGELVNFEKYTTPIISFLKFLGVNAHYGGRHDILIEGNKISGNASHVFKSRVMHHGTLLYNSKLESLTQALKNDPLKFKDKAVKSVRSKVTNIQNHLEKEKPVNNFVQELYTYIQNNYECSAYLLSDDNYSKIDILRKEKYSTWEWNFGYSPKYLLKKRIKTKGGFRYEINLQVNKGLIIEASIRSNSKNTEWINKLQNLLSGTMHHKETLIRETEDVFNESKDLKQDELINALF